MKNAMKYKKILILGGTTEGRVLCEHLKRKSVEVWLSVATQYGKELMQDVQGLHLLQNRLDEAAMIDLLEQEQFGCVIDATHPYAQIVTQNIKVACAKTGILYKRLLRENACKENDDREEQILYFKTLSEIVAYLNATTGNVLLTTGSKDLETFSKLENYQERLYVRMLPMPQTLQEQMAKGFKMSHFVCMQGPFSYEMNVALLKHVQAAYMVTKDSGDIGGVKDKVEAALEVGVKVLCLERPIQEEGMSLEAIYTWLEEE